MKTIQIVKDFCYIIININKISKTSSLSEEDQISTGYLWYLT